MEHGSRWWHAFIPWNEMTAPVGSARIATGLPSILDSTEPISRPEYDSNQHLNLFILASKSRFEGHPLYQTLIIWR